MIRFLLLLMTGLAVLAENPLASSAGQRPNLIYILADDLGFGDLGCYGQTTLKTPHLDHLAKKGIRFTRHYSGSTVCAPSRCVLMTGLHTGHARIRGNGPGRLHPSDVTVARLLQESGYTTGCFGKWGIGNPPPLDDPNQHGFDEFYGYINMYHAHNFYPEFLIHNGKKEPLGNQLYADWKTRQTTAREGRGVAETAIDYAPELIFDRTLKFIRRHHEEPFFLYYALNIPHANNEGGGDARIGNNGMRSPLFSFFDDEDWPIQEKGFAGMIKTIDDHVGQLMSLLESLNIAHRTAVLFSSDNGPHQEGRHRMEFFNSNGPLRGMKRDLYEGGIRVPFIAYCPDRFPGGRVSNLISGFQDIFPTLLDLAGIHTRHRTDGISLVPTLTGNPARQVIHPHLYWEFYEQGGKVAVLQGNWKAVRRNILEEPKAPIELYDLRSDLGEANDIANKNRALVTALSQIMEDEHIDP